MPKRSSLLAVLAAALACLPAGAAPTLPRRAPDFSIATATGQIKLSQYGGKVLLVVFVYTTCPHCQQATRFLNAMQKEYGPRGLQVLASAFDQYAPVLLRDFIARFRPEYPMGISEREATLGFLQHSPQAPFYVPIFVFIDRKGMIRGQYLGNDGFFQNEDRNTRTLLETLLKEPAPRPRRAATKE